MDSVAPSAEEAGPAPCRVGISGEGGGEGVVAVEGFKGTVSLMVGWW